jgi:hypothetical protein
MPLKVIGAGMGRTGTKTLKFALERLGFGPGYHLNDLIGTPAHWPFWEQVADGHRSDFETFFDPYESAVDAPAWRYFHVLSARYPAAKVVLTVRDQSQWFESACATVLSDQVGATLAKAPPPVPKIVNTIGLRGAGPKMRDRDYMMRWFDAHNADVRLTIPTERLLVYEVSQGWAPLCGFLGVAVPDEAFPHANHRAGMVADIAGRLGNLTG